MALRGSRGMGAENTWNITTLYFSNFPNSYGARDLSNIFRRWGEILDVFIARRLNKSGGRYGFVKFANVRNVRRLLSELNTIRIGNMKMYVNLPWFNKELSNESVGKRSHAFTRSSELGKKISMKEFKPEQRKQIRKYNSKPGESREKKEQVWKVKKVNTIQYKRMFTSEIRGVDWLEDCMVGWSLPDVAIEDISRMMAKTGFGCIRVRHMGDNMFLLSTSEGYCLKDFIEDHSDGFAEIFHPIKIWEPNSYAGNKCIWIQVRGLPHIFWNEKCFRFIVAKLGTLSEIDRGTTMWDRLDYARLKVRTPISTEISNTEKVLINGVECMVSLREEIEGNIHDSVDGWSSDSTSSLSTWPEELDPNMYVEEDEEVEMHGSDMYGMRRGGEGEAKRVELVRSGSPKMVRSGNGSAASGYREDSYHECGKEQLATSVHGSAGSNVAVRN